MRLLLLPSLLPIMMLAVLAGCASDGEGGQCVMREEADLPVLNDRFQPIVRAKVNDQPVAFMVDTGADLSVVTPKAVEALSLPVDYDHRVVMTGIGGSVLSNLVEIRRLDLGHGSARDVEFVQAGAIGGSVDRLPVVGLFGADFLANYDVEFDLPAHHVALYREQGCDAHFTEPWPGDAYTLPFDLERDRQVKVPIRLDGAPLVVQLDSGAGGTILTLDHARTAGATGARGRSRRHDPGDRREQSKGVSPPLRGARHRPGTRHPGPGRRGRRHRKSARRQLPPHPPGLDLLSASAPVGAAHACEVGACGGHGAPCITLGLAATRYWRGRGRPDEFNP